MTYRLSGGNLQNLLNGKPRSMSGAHTLLRAKAGAAEYTCSGREITWVNEAHLPLTKLGHIASVTSSSSSFPAPLFFVFASLVIYFFLFFSTDCSCNQTMKMKFRSLDFDSSIGDFEQMTHTVSFNVWSGFNQPSYYLIFCFFVCGPVWWFVNKYA